MSVLCDCRIFRMLPRFLHFQQSVLIAYFSTQIGIFDSNFNIICVSVTSFYYVLLPRPSGCQQNGTIHVSGPPVERDGVVGFKQFCTIFPHISTTYLVFMRSAYSFFFRKCRIKLTCLTRSAGVIHCFTLSLSWLSRVSAFYPRDATLARVLAMAPCLCLCLSQVGVLACLSVSVTSRCFTQVT